MNPVKITETVLRDSHQSLIATRMTIDEILPSLELLDKVGYHAMEVWGGVVSYRIPSGAGARAPFPF